MKEYKTNSSEETIDLAFKIGSFLKKGYVILLNGELGAGKTTFSKGIGRALGIKNNISSPSFTILKRYEVNEELVLNHLDLYRLEGVNFDFDLEEYILDEDSITVIEWPFQVEELLPKEYLLIDIKYISDEKRSFNIIPKGKKYEELVSKL
ncbi:tRNA (adenosine(37)-N6)-threonylcarbamoyltransferase complex ATPase subunit type 1 TsaE [Acholeplasma sp. OttesenSCG-928-E16]|nr:tRNA (adenosine(37)-N6)-threonylcarbamoyltransferase complex ATPase subunit type 1 TsaE [Acholeplasma sp. OttesenSCG-928-E16]